MQETKRCCRSLCSSTKRLQGYRHSSAFSFNYNTQHRSHVVPRSRKVSKLENECDLASQAKRNFVSQKEKGDLGDSGLEPTSLVFTFLSEACWSIAPYHLNSMLISCSKFGLLWFLLVESRH